MSAATATRAGVRIDLGPAIAQALAEARPGMAVLGDVVRERDAQDARWGQQDHPDVSPELALDLLAYGHDRDLAQSIAAEHYGMPLTADAKVLVDTAAATGSSSWLGIALEELTEALEAAVDGDELAVRTEVLQLAAVCVQWAQAIDRRRGGQ